MEFGRVTRHPTTQTAGKKDGGQEAECQEQSLRVEGSKGRRVEEFRSKVESLKVEELKIKKRTITPVE
jgi:hypothetical protein